MADGPDRGRARRAAIFNSYPLVHVDGVDEALCSRDKPDVRPFILTRSGFGGIQRASAAVWSGDVASRWDNLRDQIAAGINLSMSGDPNWSHDIGGYTMEQRFSKPTAADLDEWRELNTRWFQFGAFSPIFRSHGENIQREIYEMSPDGSLTYSSMVWYDRLRYRLMPYIYTLGADTYFNDGTIMRGLVMDFAADKRAWGIDDEYLFGPAFLVAPVTEYKARSRKVYLPAGANWYDFYSGRSLPAARRSPPPRRTSACRCSSAPARSSRPGPRSSTPARTRSAPVTLYVYTGADGQLLALRGRRRPAGSISTGNIRAFPLSWDEATKTLTIGARERHLCGNGRQARTIHIRWIKPGPGRAPSFDAQAGKRQSLTPARRRQSEMR